MWPVAASLRLKTVQKLGGEDLPVSNPVSRQMMSAITVSGLQGSMCLRHMMSISRRGSPAKVLAREYGLGSMDGFQFNMSVGYDLEGIKTEKIDRFIEGMKDASEAPIFAECRQWLLDNLDRFENLTKKEDVGESLQMCATALPFLPFTDVLHRKSSALPDI